MSGADLSVQDLGLVLVVFACIPLQVGRLQRRLCELSEPQERATIMSLDRYLMMSLGSLAISSVIGSSGIPVGMLVAGIGLGSAGLLALGGVLFADRHAEPALAARPIR